ncbi:nuclear transport factor 2 family protein [Rathayibacter soli]|uniref:nuclear transport factor 2 family protein n=1 Tax=Rathayibacter soli TaxID=3144168 RepID=UPI0027E40786|nr:nuclear transport factor 2 family protein [Glaciibacter superstes]
MDSIRAKAIATAYIDTVGRGDLAPLDELLADDLVASVGGNVSTKQEWIAALGRLLPALVRNDIRHAYADGDNACVVYDFVTNTPAGAVVCVEDLEIDAEGRIRRIELVFDKVAFAPVNAALQERAARVP